MPNHLRRWLRAGTLALCLLLTFGTLAPAQDEVPAPLPFESIAGEGSVSITVGAGDVYYRLAFDADFRLNRQSDGIQPGDDVQIITSLAYPVPRLEANPLGLPFNRLVVRLAVAGQCFVPRGRALLFRAPDEGAIAGCAEVGIQIFDGNGAKLFDGDFDHILRSATIELLPAGRQGRWKLRSVASFFNPGYPFPVAGYAYDAAGNRLTSGVTLVVGDDSGLSPFRSVGFRTLAP